MLLTGDVREYLNRYEECCRSLRAATGLPEGLHGTVDAYSNNSAIALVQANLQYDPRPAYLSLNAHTKRLAERNAEFLAGPRAPQLLLVDKWDVMGYPPLQDGPSWLQRLSRYDLQTSTPELFIYARRDFPIPLEKKPLQELSLRWGETVKIPRSESGILWAELDIKRSFLGEIAHTLFRTPHANLEVTDAAGSRLSYQIVPQLGSAGFVLSPTIRSADDIENLSHLEKGSADSKRK